MKNNLFILKQKKTGSTFLDDIKVYIAKFTNTEDQIYVEDSEVEGRNAKRQIEDSSNFLKISGTAISKYIGEYTHAAIDGLQAEAENIVAVNCDGYITGFKIFYAIKNNTFAVYFRPVKFCRDANDPSTKTIGQGMHVFGHYRLTELLNTYYYYDSTTESFVEETNAANKAQIVLDIQLYKDNTNGVEIQRKRGVGTFSRHNNTNDPTGDVECIIYSFQELIALREANPGSDAIRVWNAVEEVVYDDVDYIKHRLILSSDQIAEVNHEIGIKPFEGKFANLSHLCPPSCGGDGFTFRLRA